MLETLENCGRWSGIVAETFPEAKPGLRILEKMLSISALELLLVLVGCKMCGKNVWDEREPRKSLVGAW